MISKINSGMNFTSNVNKMERYRGLAFDLQNFDERDLKELDRAIEQLKNNGNDDDVTIYPLNGGDCTFVGVQVIKGQMIGKQSVDTLMRIDSEEVIKAYQSASINMVPRR